MSAASTPRPTTGGLVTDGIDPGDRVAGCGRVAEVEPQVLGIGAQICGDAAVCQWVKRVDYGHAWARRDEAVDDVRADEAGAARHENVFGSAHQPVATMLWIRMAQPACAASSPRRAPALRIAAVASMSHGRNGSQMRSTSAFDRPLTSATNPHPRPTPSRARAPRLSPALQRAQTAPGLASHAPDGANQRRSKRLRAYAGAIFSAGSSTNT